MGVANRQLLIGIAGSGTNHTSQDNFDVDTRFRMVKEAGVFDFVDRMPPTGELDAYLQASRKYDIPIRAGGYGYVVGRDEPLLLWHLRISKEMGAPLHNMQIRPNDATGQPISDEEVAATYLWAAEEGDKLGVDPALETHINTWSEHFGRVSRVGELVEKRGVPFNITLDHAHLIFKIDNPAEQEVQGLRRDVEAGRVELDPAKPGNVAFEWISRNYVRNAHARASVPANPINIWARHPDGRFGRGIQYPWLEPAPGEWHSEWDETRLESWKKVTREMLRHHATDEKSRLTQITMEFIPGVEYGGGAKYSIFANNIACANWIRDEWEKAQATAAESA